MDNGTARSFFNRRIVSDWLTFTSASYKVHKTAGLVFDTVFDTVPDTVFAKGTSVKSWYREMCIPKGVTTGLPIK